MLDQPKAQTAVAWLSRRTASWLAVAVAVGCGSDAASPGTIPGASGPGDDPAPSEAGVELSLAVHSDALVAISADLEVAREHDAASLSAQHAVAFRAELGHDPRQALGLDRIQASAVALNDAELSQFAEQGFVILRRKHYPSFPYGYFDLYGSDLPVFVTADMVLEALHRSYDDILKAIELASLQPTLGGLLDSMRARLAGAEHGLDEQAARDADFFLGVAASLLREAPVAPVTDLDPDEIASFVGKATAASGSDEVTIFGTVREIDFSQFKPRGHYEGEPVLERYFRAMIWLGRIDLRFIETQRDGSQKFWRRQVETALALRSLLDEVAFADWSLIDRTIGAFVGEHDYMVVPELDELLTALGSTVEAGLGQASDAEVAQAIIAGQYGEQRIASHIIRKSPRAQGTLPLNASFAFFGQRYTVDSHVFSNLVFDRVATRILPNPLDAAFAALGNDQAVQLLSGELRAHPYAGDLSAMRTLVDAHPAEYWQSSLYTSWLGTLRALSPNVEGVQPQSAGLPAVAQREAWGRRLLNTQLASWAELRHDTILYAKQSYTVGTECEFPDAYVEPYPEFFRAVMRFAELGQSVVGGLPLGSVEATLVDGISGYFARLFQISGMLAEMAELQRTGMPHTSEHVAFINQAIRVEGGGSGDPWQTGWYKDLFFNPDDGLKFDPTIADVHTDPGGVRPIVRDASVLHVGTGRPRPLIVSVDTCEGPRAYAGIVFAYHEHLEPGLNRLTDNEWESKLQVSPPPDVPWLEPVLAAP